MTKDTTREAFDKWLDAPDQNYKDQASIYWSAFAAGSKHATAEAEAKYLPALKAMDTAPKDKPILIDAGYPWLVMAIWNEAGKNWVYANLQVDMYMGNYNDTYWESEYESPVNSKGIPNVFGWIPVPELDGMEIDKKARKA